MLRQWVAVSMTSHQHLIAAVVTQAAPLLGHVEHVEQGRLRLAIGDEGAEPRLACQVALLHHVADRLVGGYAADAEVMGQLLLRRELVVSRPVAALDLLQQVLLDLQAERGRTAPWSAPSPLDG
jgi:hypothetical protein